MRTTTLTISVFGFLCAMVSPLYSTYAQCYGPTATGTYTGGKKPGTNSNYFINHVFSSFNNTSSGSLNGNNFSISTTATATTNDVTNTLVPGETLVTGSGFPSTNPSMHRISTNSTGNIVTHTFTSDLAAGTHVFLQDVDRLEGIQIVFKNASGTVIDPSGFTPFNVSTANLPTTYTATTTSLSFKSTSSTNRSEPLVGIIITSSVIRSIEFTVTTVASTASNVEFFYSVPLMPSFTATASNNGPLCAGSTLTLTGGTSALAATVPTPVNYIWSGPNSYGNTTTSTTASITAATTAASGTYTLTVQDAFGCFTSTAVTTTATVNSSPSLSLSSNSPVNYSNTITLSSTITGGSAPLTISWSGPNSFSSSTQSPSISSVTSANAGIYTLNVSDNNGCSVSGTTHVRVKSGWIYIHDKNINEESSQDFTFTLKDNSGNTLKTFYTNDSAGNSLNVYDMGAGHDDGAGSLWVIAGSTNGASTGTIYYRASGSTNWIATNVTTATAIDGAALNQCVYVNSSGDGYFYNAGTSTKIFDHTVSHNGQTATASDITYGAGKIALRNSNGRVYLYIGNYSNDSWNDISANTNMATRIDMSSDGTKLVYILSATVKTYTISSGAITTLPAFTATSGAGASATIDVAIDDNGTIYGTGTTGNTSCCGNTDIVYSYPSGATAWTAEPEARGVKRITGGPAGQAWGCVNLGSAFLQTIYTRVVDNTGTHIWLDDERVKNSSSLNGNSCMIEVNSGTYKVIETLPSSVWDLGRFNLYDPTGNTTGNTAASTATVKPAWGESVNVEFIDEKLNTKVIDNANCNTSILQSFDAGNGTNQFGTGTFGTPVGGTAYHYFNQTSPQDGYYYLAKTTDGNWFTTPGVTDHTGNSGYFYLVNASYAKDEFYRQRITGLTGSLTYRIQFYASNVLTANPIKPKIRFGMQTLQGVIFGDSTTDELSTSAWTLYSVSFTVPSGVSTADLFLRNENIGGLGNDLAIDDISINPIPTPLDTNSISPGSILCVGSTYTITNSITGGSWTVDDPSVVSIDSATGTISVLKAGSANITYTYVNNIYCKSTSTSDVSIQVPPNVSVSSSSFDVCKAATTILHANASNGTAPYSYLWSGSNGTISSNTDADPMLTAPSTEGAYNYSVQVTDNSGCSSTTSTIVTVHDPDPRITLTCQTNVPNPYSQIIETEGSTGDSWLWSSSSSNALFYGSSAMNNGTSTSTLQSPYVNYASQYKVVLTDAYGCKDSTSIFYDNSACTLLAVSLLNFTVAKNGDNILLNWKTAFDKNNKYFAIERSIDENVWKEIGRVSATGNGNNTQSYTFSDLMPANGINYYRLKQIDANGNFSYSNIRSVMMSNNWKVIISPNPVTGGIVQIKSNQKITTVQITDVNGKILYNKPPAPATSGYYVDVPILPRGFYFVQMINNKMEIYYTNFIKN